MPGNCRIVFVVVCERSIRKSEMLFALVVIVCVLSLKGPVFKTNIFCYLYTASEISTDRNNRQEQLEMPADDNTANPSSVTQQASQRLENEAELGGPKFNPPLYRQRYSTVSDILREENVSSVSYELRK